MTDLIKLSLRLLRKHAALYAGCMVTIGATALISSVQLGLVGGFSDPQEVVLPGVSDNELAVQLPMIRFQLYFFCGLAVTVSGFMMWSAVRQVVSFRHEELGLMRLAGASRLGLARMVLIECFAMGLVVALPCSILGALLTPVFFSALQLIHFFGSGVETQFPFSFAGTVVVTVVMSMLAALAGFVATLSATRGDPVAATSPMSARLSRWQLVWRLGVLAAGLYCAVLLDPQLIAHELTIALPAMGVIPLVVVAPLCIPLGAQVIGRAAGKFLPGPGLLAAQRASKDRLRFARTAVPAIICVGALGSFLVANAPDEQARNEFNLSRIAASSVSEVRGASDADSAYSSLETAQNADGGAVARLSVPERRAASGARSDLPYMVFYFADVVPLTRLVRQDVLEGDVEAVGGLDVASTIEGYHVGDTLTTRDRDGNSVTLRVVAVVDNPVHEGMLVDWREASRLVASTADLEVDILASDLTTAQAEDVLKDAKVEATVHSREAYVQRMDDERKSATNRSNIGVFGTVYLMSLISLAQSSVSANLARRREFSVLGSLGVDRKGTILLVATETIIVQAVAGALVALVLVILGLRFASLNGGVSPVAVIASAAPTTAAVYGTVLILSLVFQVLGAYVAWSKASREV